MDVVTGAHNIWDFKMKHPSVFSPLKSVSLYSRERKALTAMAAPCCILDEETDLLQDPEVVVVQRRTYDLHASRLSWNISEW